MVLGASWHGSETHFAVYSSVAAYDGHVQLCLLDGRGGEERVPMAVEHDIWSVDPARCRAGPEVRLPGRRAVRTRPGAASSTASPARRSRMHVRSNRPRRAGRIPSWSIRLFDWGDDHPPDIPVGTRQFSTKRTSRASANGTPAFRPRCAAPTSGWPARPSWITWSDWGSRAVELMPVHQSISEQRLLDLGLTNYWGYSTFGVLRTALRLPRRYRGRQSGHPVQATGQGAAPGRPGGHPGRRLQPHRRRARPSSRRSRSAGWPTRSTTGSTPTTRPGTPTAPAPATP